MHNSEQMKFEVMRGVGDVVVGGEHSGSPGEEMVTEHCESTVLSTPATMMLAPPPLTQASIKRMSEPLSISEVPSSLAR